MPGKDYRCSASGNQALTLLDERLDPSKPLQEDAAMVLRWRALEDSSLKKDAYEEALTKNWRVTGCAADGAPYVITALVQRMDGELSKEDPWLPRLAAAFLDPACEGARDMSEATRAKLVKLSKPLAAQAAPTPQ